MDLTITATVLLLLGVAVLAVFAAWAYQTANRLNRLHVRYDLSWQALDAALARRAVVARAVAVDAYHGAPEGKRLATLADVAERAPRNLRENTENELSAALALVDASALPAELVAELADAEARVLLARRFHNDAVRDTRALGGRPLVRLLRLGGTAGIPEYFEIAERADAAARVGHGVLNPRTSARTVLLDETGAVLLLCGSDPALGEDAPWWWFTVGGQVDAGEALSAAAARELAEETGLRVDGEALIGPVWRRNAVFSFNGATMNSQEFYFVHRTARFTPSPSSRTELEQRYLHGHRWCDAAQIAELTASGQTVYPLQLGELLAEAGAVADAPPGPGRPARYIR
ncbi:NUDIX domain-containing protein [Mycobacterium sp. M1]|uniref:NUDIX domain-containing protein n=1 Tax=Mycolicibacter acidiphilus TaxID=2835306 RepID=A0ABS5RCV4_9MYCO|nr:NUDIX domain-containing protein [Mycolicibacter acidiphilus]MBS9532110.1 NUDIX domain-containing protein [Mycolicibacter acidiphilus]